MASPLQALYDERAALVKAQRDTLTAAGDRELTAEENETYTKRDADISALSARIDRENKLAIQEAALNQPAPRKTDPASTTQAERPQRQPSEYSYRLPTGATRKLQLTGGSRCSEAYGSAWNAFLRSAGNFHALTPEHRAALQVDLDPKGGYVTATERFIARVIEGADLMTAIRPLATVLTAGYGTTVGIPTLDADVAEMTWGGGETGTATETDVTFGKRELKGRPINGLQVKVSRALLNNALIDIEGFIASKIARSMAYGGEQAYMTGNGAEQPLGLFTASADGIPTSRDYNAEFTIQGSGPDITAEGLISSQGTLRMAYRPAARWLFHPDTGVKIRKLQLGDGQFLWQPGIIAGQPDTLLGSPIVWSEKCPNTYTASSYFGIYGDFSYYWILDGFSDMAVVTQVETYATTNQVGYVWHNISGDAMPVLAEAFVRLQLAAS